METMTLSLRARRTTELKTLRKAYATHTSVQHKAVAKARAEKWWDEGDGPNDKNNGGHTKQTTQLRKPRDPLRALVLSVVWVV